MVEKIESSDGKLTGEFVIFTREMQEQALTNNPNNRRLGRRNVTQIKDMIYADVWKDNGIPIQFDEDGELFNGQHRITAFYEMGVEPEVLVVCGVSKDAIDTVDTGRKRTGGDTIKVMSDYTTSESTHLHYAFAWLCKYELENFYINQRMLRNDEVAQYLSRHPKIEKSVKFVSKRPSNRAIISKPICIFLHYMFMMSHEAHADFFLNAIYDGGMRVDCASNQCRNALIDMKAPELNIHAGDKVILLINSWNRTWTKGVVKKLKTASTLKRKKDEKWVKIL